MILYNVFHFECHCWWSLSGSFVQVSRCLIQWFRILITLKNVCVLTIIVTDFSVNTISWLVSVLSFRRIILLWPSGFTATWIMLISCCSYLNVPRCVYQVLPLTQNRFLTFHDGDLPFNIGLTLTLTRLSNREGNIVVLACSAGD